MGLLDWIYPPKCIACRMLLPFPYAKNNTAGYFLCDHCITLFAPIAAPFCARCGHPLPEESAQGDCFSCNRHQWAFTRHRAAFVYDGAVQDMMHGIKFRGQRRAAQGLGILLAGACTHWGLEADVVVPVPLHVTKKRRRGFNQAAVVAKEVAKAMRLPLWENVLLRTKNTKPQSGLSAQGRAQNLNAAFACFRHKDVAGKRVLLVDDIFTTGATAHACAMVLRQAGASRVECICASIAVLSQEE